MVWGLALAVSNWVAFLVLGEHLPGRLVLALLQLARKLKLVQAMLLSCRGKTALCWLQG